MQCKLIVWDECTMAHKKSLEALNFTLKDLRRNYNIFGGLMILLAGDFRQTLPVIPRGTPATVCKVGSVIMILRNLNPPRLCNGTRLAVKRLMPNLIEATIINGKYAGENVCIPRIPMIPTDLPFDFKRLQFPVRLAFAMTINKSQGQSLSVCGINLENHCFSHGQLYVACSRVGKPSALFVLTSDQKTKNVVYQRALQ